MRLRFTNKGENRRLSYQADNASYMKIAFAQIGVYKFKMNELQARFVCVCVCVCVDIDLSY